MTGARTHDRRSPPCRRPASTSRHRSLRHLRPIQRRPTWCSRGSTSRGCDSWQVASTWAYPVRSAQRLRDPAAAVATVLRPRPAHGLVLHPAETLGDRPPVILTGELDDADAHVLPTGVRRPRTA